MKGRLIGPLPGRNGAEIVIEALNAGTAPAPYGTVLPFRRVFVVATRCP